MRHDVTKYLEPQESASESNVALCEVMRRSFEADPFESIEDFLSCLERLLGTGDLIDLHRKMAAKYGMPGLGTSRVTYLSKSAVFKVPIAPEGWRFNDAEYSLVSTYFVDENCLGRTRLLEANDIPILAMEYITPASLGEIIEKLGKIPDWVSAIDMAQVGFSKSGHLKAYDYADLL